MQTLIIIVFIAGYLAIALEHFIKLNKAASALITGVSCWTIYILYGKDVHLVNHQLLEHLGDISGILFFLMGAMTIVELIDAHDGFELIKEKIKTQDKKKLLFLFALISFFLSAILDNLTTTIVMVTLAGKLIDSRENRLFFAGIIVIAANAGGAWSPIGDVTTTMLWIGGQITAMKIITAIFLPSLICLLVPLFFIGGLVKGKINSPATGPATQISAISPRQRNAVLIIGLTGLLLVPAFKTYTHLPPFMGMLLVLGLIWAVTEFINHERDEADKDRFSVNYALRKIDVPSILFLGILISVAALQSTGVLTRASGDLAELFPDQRVMILMIGFLSSLVDNVPLVAATQGMYSLQQFPVDDAFWHFLTYCTGTGGSMLIIGSAAGVAAMAIEKVEFFWWLKRITLWAMLGYLAGAGVYVLQRTEL